MGLKEQRGWQSLGSQQRVMVGVPGYWGMLPRCGVLNFQAALAMLSTQR